MRHIPKWNLYDIFMWNAKFATSIFFPHKSVSFVFFSWETNLFKGSEINKKIITKGTWTKNVYRPPKQRVKQGLRARGEPKRKPSLLFFTFSLFVHVIRLPPTHYA